MATVTDNSSDSSTESEDTQNEDVCLYLDAHGVATEVHNSGDDTGVVRASREVDIDVTIPLSLWQARKLMLARGKISRDIRNNCEHALREVVKEQVEAMGYEMDYDQMKELDVTLDGTVCDWIDLAEKANNPSQFCANVSGKAGIGVGVNLAYGEFRRRDGNLTKVQYE